MYRIDTIQAPALRDLNMAAPWLRQRVDALFIQNGQLR